MTLRSVSLWAVLVDQLSKYLIVRLMHLDQSVQLIKGFLYITYIQNPGAAFGFMAENKAYIRIPFFVAITVGAGMIVYAYQRFVPKERSRVRFALGLIWGGAMGNFIDRVFYRKVVDFINVQVMYHHQSVFPWIFNVADSCITVGLAILILSYWFDRNERPI
jgi:signal peptidase II